MQSRALTAETFIHFCGKLQPNDRFTIGFFDAAGVFVSVDEPRGHVWHGTFIERNATGSFDVRYDEEPSTIRQLPVPQDEFIVTEIKPLHDVGFVRSAVARLPPFTFASSDVIATPDVVIYFDGGFNPNTKEATAAVVAKVFVPGEAVPQIHKFARYYVGGTNNVAEHLALTGALRLALWVKERKWCPDIPLRNIAVVGDSDNAIRQALKMKTVRAPLLLRFVEDERRTIGDPPTVHIS